MWGGGSDLEAGDDPGMLKVSQRGHQVPACRREALEASNDCTLLAFPGGPRLLRGTPVPSSDVLPEVRRWEKQKRDAQLSGTFVPTHRKQAATCKVIKLS